MRLHPGGRPKRRPIVTLPARPVPPIDGGTLFLGALIGAWGAVVALVLREWLAHVVLPWFWGLS